MPSPKTITLRVQAPGAVPDWLPLMGQRIWYQLAGPTPDLGLSPTNLATNINPDPSGTAPYRGTTGFTSLFSAWNSAFVAMSLGQHGSQVNYGNGHRDYYGNGAVRFDYGSRFFSMLNQPSTAGPFTSLAPLSNGGFNDGSHGPVHTYNYLDFDPATNQMIVCKSAECINAPDSSTSASLAIPYMLNVATQQWRRGPQAVGVGSDTDGFQCHDVLRGQIIHCDPSNGDFSTFNPTTVNGDGTFGTWTTYAAPGQYGSGNAMTHDTTRDVLLITNNAANAIFKKLPGSLAAARTTVTILNAGPTLSVKSSWNYSSALDGCVFHRAGTAEVWLLTTTDNWVTASWTNLSVAANGKSFAATNGFYQKSRVVQFGTIAVQVLTLSATSGALAARLN